MNYRLTVSLVCTAFITSAWAQAGDTEKDRLKESRDVIQNILESPDKGIPQGIMESSKCIIIFPGTKSAAFGIGGTYGRGVMTCRTGRDFDGPWSDPIMMATESGSIGFQIGISGTDYVILVRNNDGARAVMKSRLKLGADASIAAGPVGRSAEASTTGNMQAAMLSYSESHGVFAGVSLSGATLRVDGDSNKNLYGKEVTTEEIMGGSLPMPEEAGPLIATINEATGKPGSPPRYQ